MNKEKKHLVFHIIAGLIVLYHGFESFEKANFLSAAEYLGSSLLFFIVAGLHKPFNNRFHYADTAFFCLESITILYSGWHYKTIGNNFIYILHVIAGIGFFILAIESYYNADKPRRKHKRRRRRRNTPSIFTEQ